MCSKDVFRFHWVWVAARCAPTYIPEASAAWDDVEVQMRLLSLLLGSDRSAGSNTRQRQQLRTSGQNQQTPHLACIDKRTKKTTRAFGSVQASACCPRFRMLPPSNKYRTASDQTSKPLSSILPASVSHPIRGSQLASICP